MKYYITEKVFRGDKVRYMNMDDGKSVLLKENATTHDKDAALRYLAKLRDKGDGKIYELELILEDGHEE